MARTRLVALALCGLLWVHPQSATCQGWTDPPNAFPEDEAVASRASVAGASRLSTDGTPPLAWLERQCQEPGFPWHHEGENLSTTLWGSPLQFTWDRSGTVHYVTGLDTSYALPHEDIAPGTKDYLQGDRFRAWLRSGVQWRFTQDSVLSVDTRWSIAGLDGIEPAAPFQAAATVMVVW